jgi:hypothetical protein
MSASSSVFVPTASPDVDSFEALEIPERLLIWGARTWVFCSRTQDSAVAQLEPVFRRFGVVAAAASLDAWLCATAQTATHALEVRCPRCPNLSDDEVYLLQAAAAAQHGDFASARTQLARWLPAAVADWALGPVGGLAKIFKNAGLIMPLRSISDDARDRMTEAGGRETRRCTLH